MNSSDKKHRAIMLSLVSLSLIALFLLILPIHRQVKANRDEWDLHGFFGFPVKTTGTDTTGRSSEVILTSSKTESKPGSAAQWFYAAKQVLTRGIEGLFAQPL